MDITKIKRLGHTVEDGGMLWLLSSASEVGFRVRNAERLTLKLHADDSVDDPARRNQLPRFTIRLNGKKIIDARMTAARVSVTVFENREPADAEIRLIKLSECTQSVMALQDILTDGTVEPLEERPLKIEFIGDSITCGYGVEGRSEAETFTTATENAEKAYAFLTAEELNADAVMTCFSGHGIISGYTDNPDIRNDADLVPLYYETEGRIGFPFPSGRYADEIMRDFTAWQPDYIVLNLGTNDLSWCGTDEKRGLMYRNEYRKFMKTVRKDNLDARILCALGVMGTGLNAEMRKAAEEYCRETGDRQIRVLLLEEQNAARDGYGSDYHPNEITQRLLAGKVTDALKRWMAK